MNRIATLLLFLTCTISMTKAQTIKGNDIVYESGNSKLRISMCADNMFRVSKTTDGTMLDNEKWMVVKYKFDQVNFRTNGKEITTSRIKIHVDDNPWRITVTDDRGQTIYREIASLTRNDSVANIAAMNPNEHFFGFGERMDYLDQLGQCIHLDVGLGSGPKPAVGGKDILRANYCPVPLLLSNKGYAIFFHTGMPNDWDLGWTNEREYSFSAQGGSNDYYFIYGPEMETLIHQYQLLTGKSPMMPRSAYGLHIGSYSGGTWHHENEVSDTYVKNIIRHLRADSIPFDLFWLDSTWRNFTSLGNGGCSFEFQDLIKNPKGMIDFATENHIAMFGLHIRSLIDNGKYNLLLDEARQGGYTLQDGRSNAILNFFNDKAVDWWWKHAAKRVIDLGVKFFKTDVGSALRYRNKTTESQIAHNLFPIAYAKAPFEHFAIHNGQRGFNHTREGYAGIQRYPFIWAGDWGSEWQWFEPVIRGGLNIGLSGIGYWSHCMGGFEQYSDYDTDLYIRWCQFGMFSPVSILFGMDHPRYHAPWTYGQEAENIFIKYDSLRYTLLPYIYTAAHDMFETSRPIMSPLLYDYTQDIITYQISDQYMFGRDMMICPVTTKNALSRPVYFPGGNWVDFWTGERICGRQHKSFLTPIGIMPIFIKQDAIIPRQEAMQYVNEKEVKAFNLLIYPYSSSSYDLYEDDGITDDYQKGGFALTHIESILDRNVWRLSINKPQGKYKTDAKEYSISVYLDFEPHSVIVNGQLSNDWNYDATVKLLNIATGIANEKRINIEVM